MVIIFIQRESFHYLSIYTFQKPTSIFSKFFIFLAIFLRYNILTMIFRSIKGNSYLKMFFHFWIKQPRRQNFFKKQNFSIIFQQALFINSWSDSHTVQLSHYNLRTTNFIISLNFFEMFSKNTMKNIEDFINLVVICSESSESESSGTEKNYIYKCLCFSLTFPGFL